MVEVICGIVTFSLLVALVHPFSRAFFSDKHLGRLYTNQAVMEAAMVLRRFRSMSMYTLINNTRGGLYMCRPVCFNHRESYIKDLCKKRYKRRYLKNRHGQINFCDGFISVRFSREGSAAYSYVNFCHNLNPDYLGYVEVQPVSGRVVYGSEEDKEDFNML